MASLRPTEISNMFRYVYELFNFPLLYIFVNADITTFCHGFVSNSIYTNLSISKLKWTKPSQFFIWVQRISHSFLIRNPLTKKSMFGIV